MDNDLQKKTINDKIVLDIYYSEFDISLANKLKKMIIKEYNSRYGGYSFYINLKAYKKDKFSKATAIYLLPCDNENQVKKITQLANRNNLISISLLPSNLKNNALISLLINKSVKPIINLDVLKANNIRLNTILLKIAEKYTQRDNQ